MRLRTSTVPVRLLPPFNELPSPLQPVARVTSTVSAPAPALTLRPVVAAPPSTVMVSPAEPVVTDVFAKFAIVMLEAVPPLVFVTVKV